VSGAQLDELDRRLVGLLATDARVSNRKLAEQLDVTEGTVRGRIRRLQQEHLIAFTAITSFGLEHTSRLAFVGIQADGVRLREIAQEIADIPEVHGVLISMGRFNIRAICLFNELDALHEISAVRILGIAGVHHVETSIAVKTVKYNPRIARITADQAIENGD
jgi:DNA-binding Lrp family transcriptional regulator